MRRLRNPLITLLDEVLKPHGFARRASTWHRSSAETVAIVNLQRSRFARQYFINLGASIKSVNPAEFPNEEHAHVRIRMESEPLAVALDLDNETMTHAERGVEIVRAFADTAWTFLDSARSLDGLRQLAVNGGLRRAFITKEAAALLPVRMSNDFRDQVESIFLPAVQDLGFEIVSQDISHESFGNAFVVLQAGHVRVQIVRERSQILAALGSEAEPATWFDVGIIRDALGFTTNGGDAFGGTDAKDMLIGIARFLKSAWPELVGLLDPQQFASVKQRLTALLEQRADRTWGT